MKGKESWSLSSLPLEDIFIQVAGESPAEVRARDDEPVGIGGAR